MYFLQSRFESRSAVVVFLPSLMDRWVGLVAFSVFLFCVLV